MKELMIKITFDENGNAQTHVGLNGMSLHEALGHLDVIKDNLLEKIQENSNRVFEVSSSDKL